MTTATATGTPPAPAVPALPSKGATIGEHMEAKRRAIRAKAPEPSDAEGGAGGGGTVESVAPAQPSQAANDSAGKGAEGETEQKATPDKPDPAKAEEERRAAARAEREQRQRVVQEAISLRAEKRKLRQMRADQEARETRIKQAETERAELEDLRKKDPVAYARRMGFTVRELAERDLADEKARPKVPIEDLPPELRTELEEGRKFREEQARKEKEREERETEATRKRKAAEAESAGQAHIGAVFDDEAADYPHLSNYFDRDTVVASAWHIMIDHWAQNEEELDLRQVLGYMEENARKEREKFSKPLPPKGVPDRATREASQASNPEPTTMSQSDATSGAPVKRVEDMQQRRDRIAKRRS